MSFATTNRCSWQIVPENMEELLQKPGAYKTMMEQHKIIIAEY